jgi:hypothetical protein
MTDGRGGALDENPNERWYGTELVAYGQWPTTDKSGPAITPPGATAPRRAERALERQQGNLQP